ncbi:MAG: hypothetical protein OQK76_11435 [Gammaproteobacteria bacterium]|nr:hypothetical protein [Gammaproteobacteria bacterium]MCW9055476.1 hypothetical protein [Gammaproteobacteria bacterium]
MFKIISLISLLIISAQSLASDKEGRVRYNASTGDTMLDVSLGKLNLRADGNINDFISALGFEYKVPTTKIKSLIVDYNFTPSDAYMTLSIGHLTGRSIDDVASFYRSNQARGWGYVAKGMGIKPGSSEFHQLRQGSQLSFLSENNEKPAKNNKAKGKGKENKNNGQGKNKGKKDH